MELLRDVRKTYEKHDVAQDKTIVVDAGAEEIEISTYSMRLLSERYRKGTVSFTSTEEEGTTFTARYPLKLGG